MNGTMLMQQKADTASSLTVMLSGLGAYMHLTNKWVAEFMPLITAIGIIGGLLVTIWYYRRCANQRQREIDIRAQELIDQAEQREHELAMIRERQADADRS